MRGPSLAEIHLEMARLAHGYHWSLDTVLDLEHADRHRFLSALDALEQA
jgi:hypothetical protein